MEPQYTDEFLSWWENNGKKDAEECFDGNFDAYVFVDYCKTIAFDAFVAGRKAMAQNLVKSGELEDIQ